MKIKIQYNGSVDDSGTLKIHRRNELKTDLFNLFRKMDVIITIEKKSKKRSVLQNAYYWAVVVPMVKSGLTDNGYSGVTIEKVHSILKSNFNIREIVNEDTGEIKKYIGSTTEMTTTEMMEYFSEIQQWASEELHIYIPDPGEQVKIKFE